MVKYCLLAKVLITLSASNVVESLRLINFIVTYTACNAKKKYSNNFIKDYDILFILSYLNC